MGRRPSAPVLREIIAQIRALLAQPAPDLVRIGRLIRQAHADASIDAVHEQCGLGLRKTYDLMAIATAVDEGLLTSVEVQKIGWSKARAIATHSRSRAEARRALAFAAMNTNPALVAYLKGDHPPEGLITKSFHLTNSQAAMLERKLRQAGGRISGGRMQNRADALMTILRAFNSATRRKAQGR
jgi:hypothetical protein